jgi:phage terminase large subunit-like protein
MLTLAQRRELDLFTRAIERRAGANFKVYFPDCLPGCKADSLTIADHVVRPGFKRPNCRVLYPKSIIFFTGGRIANERLFLAANRTSKTVSAAFETTAHLTGDYPTWWTGKRFEGPVEWWVAGDTLETTRNVIQFELLGPREAVRQKSYAGMIPAHRIADRTMKSGSVADCVDTLWIRQDERHHGAPCTSTLEFKAYAQGRLSFQGTAKHGIWLDEEPPDAGNEAGGGGEPSGNGDIYTECLMRTATTDGIVLATFTPLRGLTPFVNDYLMTGLMADESGTLVKGMTAMFGDKAA